MAWNYPDELTEAAWGLIANASDGDWSRATDEWQAAAESWRDAYHDTLGPVADDAHEPNH